MKFKSKFVALLLAAITVLTFNCNQPQQKNETADSTITTEVAAQANEPVAQQPSPTAGKNVLAGDWTRTDAPYQIKISELLEDGSMEVGYFNPKSIHVGKANWTEANGVLQIYIELRDENYPGSNYKLSYISEKDALSGEYFQAVEGTTYKVEFTRVK